MNIIWTLLYNIHPGHFLKTFPYHMVHHRKRSSSGTGPRDLCTDRKQVPLYIVNLCGVWLLFTMLRCPDRWASPLMSFSCSSVTAPVLLQLLWTRQLCLKTESIQILFSFNILKIICRKPLYFPSNFPFIQKLFTGNKIYPRNI